MGRKVVYIPRFWNWAIVPEFPDGWEDDKPLSPSQPDFAERRNERPVIGIVTPTYARQIHEAVSTAIAQAAMQFRCYSTVRSGTYIDWNRNSAIQEFLKLDDPPVDYILCMDADSVPQPNFTLELVSRAHALQAPIYAAAYMKKNDATECFGVDCGMASWKETLKQSMPWQWGDVIEVDWVGMGAMAIRREVFDHIQFPYMMSHYRGHEAIGEDIEFCRQCRILRIPILVDTGLCIAHYGADQLTPNQTFVVTEQKMVAAPKKKPVKGKKA